MGVNSTWSVKTQQSATFLPMAAIASAYAEAPTRDMLIAREVGMFQ